MKEREKETENDAKNQPRALPRAEELPFRRDRELRRVESPSGHSLCRDSGISYNRRRYGRFLFHIAFFSSLNSHEEKSGFGGEEREVCERKFSHADLMAVALTDRDGNANHVRAGTKFVV